jgi:hypothetical protein
MADSFNKFNEVEPKRLRVFNMLDDFGPSQLKNYLGEFSTTEQLEMQVMSAYIKKHGPDKVRKEVTAGVEFRDDGNNSAYAAQVAVPEGVAV